MFIDEEIAYWAARAAEERRVAATLPEGPSAMAHLALARLYEKAIREKRSVAQVHPSPAADIASLPPGEPGRGDSAAT